MELCASCVRCRRPPSCRPLLALPGASLRPLLRPCKNLYRGPRLPFARRYSATQDYEVVLPEQARAVLGTLGALGPVVLAGCCHFCHF